MPGRLWAVAALVPGSQCVGFNALARSDCGGSGQPRDTCRGDGTGLAGAQHRMSSGSAVTSGLSAALRLAWGRPDGVVLVPGDRESIVRSFWSIAFCLPSVVGRLLMSWASAGVPTDALHVVGRDVVVFVLGWLVFVEVTYRLAPLIGKAERWGRFI